MSNKSTLAKFLVENPKQWLDTNTINEVAGKGGTARLRELRADGWPIKTQRTGNKFSYQLTRVPAKAKIAALVK